MTFKEISAWISLIVLGAIYGDYFVNAPHTTTQGEALGLFVAVAIAIIVVETATHVIAAIFHRPEKTDERDRVIGGKAFRNAYFVMSAGVVGSIFYLLMSGPWTETLTFPNVPHAIMGAHLLVLTAALTEAMKFGSQIVYYRRGA